MWWFSKLPSHLPRATGPYEPGCVDVQLGFSIDGIFMRLYYPTIKKNREETDYRKWFPSIPEDCFEGMGNVVMINPYLIKLMYWKVGRPLVPALYGEKIAIREKIKCIIMSHGLGGFRGIHNSICIELASRGYLVGVLEHRDESALFTYYYKSKEDKENNIKTPINFKHINLGNEHYTNRNGQVHKRFDECSKALDFFLELNKGNLTSEISYETYNDIPVDFKLEDLIGKIDLDNFIMMGHSFGGASAILTLSKRPEFKCGVLLDPWMFPIKNEGIVDKVKQPLIFINTQTFHVAANVKSMELYYKQSDVMYTILHTTHENQADTVFVVGYWLNWFMKKIVPLKGLRINNFMILQFLKEQTGHEVSTEDCDKFLKEEAENFTDGLTKPWA